MKIVMIILGVIGVLMLGSILLSLEPQTSVIDCSGIVFGAEDMVIEGPVEVNDSSFVGIDFDFNWEPVETIMISLSDSFLTDPFTLIIDDVEKQFTHKEFKRRLGFNSNEPNTIDWVGSPGVANWDGFHLNNGFLVDYEIDFRPDSIVIWRKKGTKVEKDE